MYVCPMHPEVRQDGSGKCPKCGMDLVLEGVKIIRPKRRVKDFLPLIVLFSLITIFTAAMLYRYGAWDTMYAMRMFEGSFFILFAVFKLLNWKGFVDAYQTYDILAMRSRAYAYAYPLIELVLGAAFLAGVALKGVSSITFILMTLGAVGVFKALRKGNDIPCACLGVVFKLPMTWVTLVEDLLMATMALYMALVLV